MFDATPFRKFRCLDGVDGDRRSSPNLDCLGIGPFLISLRLGSRRSDPYADLSRRVLTLSAPDTRNYVREATPILSAISAACHSFRLSAKICTANVRWFVLVHLICVMILGYFRVWPSLKNSETLTLHRRPFERHEMNVCTPAIGESICGG